MDDGVTAGLRRAVETNRKLLGLPAVEREHPLVEGLMQIEATLEKLACLGNGSRRGNSEGNCIAQDASLFLPSLMQEARQLCEPVPGETRRPGPAMSHPSGDAQNGKQVSPPPYTPGDPTGDTPNAARGEHPLVEAVEALKVPHSAPLGQERNWAIDDCIAVIRQHSGPVAVEQGIDERDALRAMWTVEFGHALMQYAEDAKRGVDSSDQVRMAAIRALAPYLRPATQAAGGDAEAELITAAINLGLAHNNDVQKPVVGFSVQGGGCSYSATRNWFGALGAYRDAEATFAAIDRFQAALAVIQQGSSHD